MLDTLIGIVRGYQEIDLKYEFDRRSAKLDDITTMAEKDKSLAYCVKSERQLVHALEKRLDRGETTLRVNRGETFYAKLMGS